MTESEKEPGDQDDERAAPSRNELETTTGDIGPSSAGDSQEEGATESVNEQLNEERTGTEDRT